MSPPTFYELTYRLAPGGKEYRVRRPYTGAGRDEDHQATMRGIRRQYPEAECVVVREIER